MTAPRTGRPFLDAAPHEPGGVIAMAHRGGAGHPDLVGLENTMAAFGHAVALGYGYLETDVHVTADGVVVAFHDAALDRVTDARGFLAQLPYAAVAEARVAGREPVPRLDDVLDAFPGVRLNIDLKAARAAAPLADLVRRRGVHDDLLVGSFSLARIEQFRRLTVGRVATAAAPPEVACFLATGRRLGAFDALQVPHRHGPLPVVTAGAVRRAHARGVPVHVWTVDDPAEMQLLLGLGVDGLITDRTDLLRDVLDGRASEAAR